MLWANPLPGVTTWKTDQLNADEQREMPTARTTRDVIPPKAKLVFKCSISEDEQMQNDKSRTRSG